jgi:putative FmdB family regulatory protein
MPIYEYKCGECGHHLETIQKISEDRLKECPACGRPALKRLVSAAGFQLKGSGWYATDFKNKGQKQGAKPEQGEKSGAKEQGEKSGSSDSSGSGDAAPEKKAHGGGACGCH